jgi:hypothetical protein
MLAVRLKYLFKKPADTSRFLLIVSKFGFARTAMGFFKYAVAQPQTTCLGVFHVLQQTRWNRD